LGGVLTSGDFDVADYARTLREWQRRFEATFDRDIVPALKEAYPELRNSAEGVQVFKRKWICKRHPLLHGGADLLVADATRSWGLQITSPTATPGSGRARWATTSSPSLAR
jgi:hypothetical protein